MGDPACLFCRIAAGEIPADVVHRDELVLAFRDINPVAPTHILLVPLDHVDSVAAVGEDDGALLGRLVAVAGKLAREEGIADSGFRIVTNTGPDAGQSVSHLHLHLLGGRKLAWPPG